MSKLDGMSARYFIANSKKLVEERMKGIQDKDKAINDKIQELERDIRALVQVRDSHQTELNQLEEYIIIIEMFASHAESGYVVLQV